MNSHRLYEDIIQETTTRFLTFTSGNYRFELALMKADHFQDQTLVINLLQNRQGLLDRNKIDQKGYLEKTLNVNEWEADELRNSLPPYL